MREKINTVVNVTNGYKTKAAAFVYLLVAIFGSKVPFIADNQGTITSTLDILIASGLAHDVWRNRDKVISWIKDLFSKDNKQTNK